MESGLLQKESICEHSVKIQPELMERRKHNRVCLCWVGERGSDIIHQGKMLQSFWVLALYLLYH